MIDIIMVITPIIIAYFLGSLSSSIIVCKLVSLPDPRQQGSGNPGATNVLRIAGKKYAFITLACDILKGFVAVMIGKILGLNGFELGLVALAAFIGHIYPIYFRFQGGKGVATLIGGILALSPILGLMVILTWIVIAVIFRYSSLAALVAAILAPFYAFLIHQPAYFAGIAMMTLLLLWRHRTNIERLRNGTEPKIGSCHSKN